MEIWAAVFAAYITGGVYFAHGISRALWKIARGVRGIPPWFRSELWTFAACGALYLCVWPAALASYALLRNLAARRAEEMQELIVWAFHDMAAEAGPSAPVAMAPPPRAVPCEPLELPGLPDHMLFFCPHDPTSFPAEDPGRPLNEAFSSGTVSFYAHGPIVWTRSVKCACGEWADVYDSNATAVRSDGPCASPSHDSHGRDRRDEA